MAWPTTDDPRTQFVTVRFTVDEESDIQWAAGVLNMKDRSALVREAVDRLVASERKRAKKQRGAR